jgi:ATP-dependent DNA ligase
MRQLRCAVGASAIPSTHASAPGRDPPVGDSWTLEIKLDGFRAIVSTRMDCAYAVARLGDVFEDGNVLFDAVVAHGVEGIVAKRLTGVYRPGYRGWVKIKNPTYWRRESEVELMQRRRERVATTRQ